MDFLEMQLFLLLLWAVMVLKQRQLNAYVTVNQFNASATQPTQPIPLLEAQQQRVTFSGVPVLEKNIQFF